MPVSVEHPSDVALVVAARDGDRGAFAQLVRRHQHSAVVVATMALGTATDADEVAQEAFLRAYTALDRFDTAVAFKPWLFRIVVNTARNRQRWTRRQRALNLRAANLAPVSGPSPDEIAAHRADAAAVVEAINRLPAADRLILTYRWYEQLSEAEIAAALGCPAGTVKSRLSRAMDRLRGQLGDEVTR